MRCAVVSRGQLITAETPRTQRSSRCVFLGALGGSAVDLVFMYIPPQMPTFYDRFLECAERWPQNTAVEIQTPDRIEGHTYSELRSMAESIAAWLIARGIQPGGRVAILAGNHPRWVAAYLGIIAAGGAAVPLDTAYHADQVAKLLRDSGGAMLFCDLKHLETAQEDVAGLNVPLVLTESAPHPETVTELNEILAQPAENFRPG